MGCVMRSVYEQRVAEQIEIQGRLLRGEDKIVRPFNWAAPAKGWWPCTDAHLAAVARNDVRTARRWLRGECEPPNIVVVYLIEKMFQRS